MYIPRTATRVSTPHFASSFRPLVLDHGPLEHTLLIPTTIHYHAAELRHRRRLGIHSMVSRPTLLPFFSALVGDNHDPIRSQKQKSSFRFRSGALGNPKFLRYLATSDPATKSDLPPTIVPSRLQLSSSQPLSFSHPPLSISLVPPPRSPAHYTSIVTTFSSFPMENIRNNCTPSTNQVWQGQEHHHSPYQ